MLGHWGYCCYGCWVCCCCRASRKAEYLLASANIVIYSITHSIYYNSCVHFSCDKYMWGAWSICGHIKQSRREARVQFTEFRVMWHALSRCDEILNRSQHILACLFCRRVRTRTLNYLNKTFACQPHRTCEIHTSTESIHREHREYSCLWMRMSLNLHNPILRWKSRLVKLLDSENAIVYYTFLVL